MHFLVKNAIDTVLFFLTLAISPIFIIFSFVFLIYRKIVDTLLFIEYRKKYGGLLGGDSLFGVEDNSRSVINALLMIEFDDKDPKYVYDSIKRKVKEKFFDNLADFPKLGSIRSVAYGYDFFIRNEFTLDDCVKLSKFQVNVDQKEYLDEDDIQNFVSSVCNTALPKNGTGLWEVLVGSRPVIWRGKKNVFPMLFRVHHCVGDGITIATYMFKEFTDDIPDDRNNPTPLQRAAARLSNTSTFTKVWSVISAIFHAPGLLISDGFAPEDETILQSSHEMSGNKIAVWAVTDKEDKFVFHVKDMKNKMKGTFFTDILLTGLCASLAEYFEKMKCENIPKSLKTGIATMFALDNLPKDTNSEIRPKLKNTFSFCMTNLPIGHTYSSKPILTRLKRVHAETRKLNNSPQFQIYYWIINNVCALIPNPIIRQLIVSPQKCCIGISSIPVSTNNTFNGHNIEHMIFWTPHRPNTGFTMAILTCGEKVQLGLMVDKLLINNKEDCQSIINNVMKNIRRLNEEMDQL